jgi:hypothetical protein
MITLEQLWQRNGKKAGLKVRYQDWNHRWKYFEIEGYDESKRLIKGKLCTGEYICYPAESQHWVVYQLGMEHVARAV